MLHCPGASGSAAPALPLTDSQHDEVEVASDGISFPKCLDTPSSLPSRLALRLVLTVSLSSRQFTTVDFLFCVKLQHGHAHSQMVPNLGGVPV